LNTDYSDHGGSLGEHLHRLPAAEARALADAFVRLSGPASEARFKAWVQALATGFPRKTLSEQLSPEHRVAHLVGEVDTRLQILYRGWLAWRAVGPMSHPERLALLERHSRPWVDIFLEHLDVPRLLRTLAPAAGVAPREFLAKLQHPMLPLKSVNLRFTYHCNVSCAHCYNHSGPRRKRERLDESAMLDLIDQLAGAGIAALNLTGGEPMLYPDLVCRLIGRARAANVARVSIMSNGAWARTPGCAERVLANLERAGFNPDQGDWIKVSAGVYHQTAGIPLQAVAHAARAYHRRFGLPLTIDYEVHGLIPETSQAAWAALGRFGLSNREATLVPRQIEPLGRGSDLESRVSRYPAALFGPCDMIDQVVVNPDGRCRPCCGMNDSNEGIVLGSIHRDSLRCIVKRLQNHPVLQAMARLPVGQVFREVAPGFQALARYASHCELCQEVLGARDPRELFDRCPERFSTEADYFPHWLV